MVPMLLNLLLLVRVTRYGKNLHKLEKKDGNFTQSKFTKGQSK